MAINKKEPKVLVIAANPFSDINNNGKTLKSIFSAFQKESLCELYFRPQDNVIGDGEFADSYYAVSDMDIIRSFVHFRKKCGGVQTFEKHVNEAVANDKTYQSFLHGNLKNNRFLRKLLWKTKIWHNKDLKSWYRECKPDVVFAMLGRPGQSYDLAIEISHELKIPLAIYWADDYLINPKRETLSDKFWYKHELPRYKDIVDKSAICYTIGDLMSEVYSKYFGIPFHSIMNTINILPQKPIEFLHEKPVLSYFGDLWLDRWKMLSKLADLVDDKGIIRIYTGNELTPELKQAFDKPNIEFMGLVRGQAFEDARYNSDILLHVESDSPEMRSKTALSISTKLPEYMMTNRCILGFGPTEVASMRLVSDNKLGFIVSSEDSFENQKKQISEILFDQSMRIEIADKAYKYAVEHFDKEKTSKRILEQLRDICNK